MSDITHEAPERIYMDPDIKFPECEKQYGCDVEYVRADILQHQTHLIEQLFSLLEITEQKEDGRYFHPTTIRSSRALDAEKLETILAELKRSITANDKSDG
jgi:hypothetical protein